MESETQEREEEMNTIIAFYVAFVVFSLAVLVGVDTFDFGWKGYWTMMGIWILATGLNEIKKAKKERKG